MRSDAFDRLVKELEGLTAEQRQAVLDGLKLLGERDDGGRLIAELLGDQIACVHCGHTEIQRFGYARSGQPRYRCKACCKTFMALTGTPFLRLSDKEKLLAYASCMSDGMTIRATAKTTELSVDRAFRWRHRFLEFLFRPVHKRFKHLINDLSSLSCDPRSQ